MDNLSADLLDVSLDETINSSSDNNLPGSALCALEHMTLDTSNTH